MQGLLHIKQQQDSQLHSDEHYIRSMLEIPLEDLQQHDEDLYADESLSRDEPLRIAICMTKSASHRFVSAQYLQSDIAFKRIVGFYEFEIAFVDEYLNTSKHVQFSLVRHISTVI